MWRGLFIIISSILILSVNCSKDKNVYPPDEWLMAPTPPMEIQPEIGDMIGEDEWRAAKTMEERRALVKRAWESREKALSEGYAEVKKRVMKLIDSAEKESKANPTKKMEIYKQAEDQIRGMTFGPATAALPIEKWVELLKKRLNI